MEHLTLLRGQGSNLRPQAHETCEIPTSPPRYLFNIFFKFCATSVASKGKVNTKYCGDKQQKLCRVN